LFSNVGTLAEATHNHRAAADKNNPFLAFEQLCADVVEQVFAFFRDTRDAAIELAFHSFYGTPWMKRIGVAERPLPHAHHARDFPQVQDAIKRLKMGGYAEGIVRMLVLLARARGAVRREKLERSDKLLHGRPPFNSMTSQARSRMIRDNPSSSSFAAMRRSRPWRTSWSTRSTATAR
jgi:hypothetical protein